MKDFSTLIGLYLDGLLGQDDTRELAAWIRRSPANAALFVRMSFIHSQAYDIMSLRDLEHFASSREDGADVWTLDGEMVVQAAQEQQEAEARRDAQHQAQQRAESQQNERAFWLLHHDEPMTPVRHIVIPRFVAWAAVVAVVCGLLLLVHSLFDREDPAPLPSVAAVDEADDTPVAYLLRQTGLAWSAMDIPYETGAALKAGRIELTHGLADVALRHGTRVTIQAPATIVLRRDNAMELQAGRVVARVPNAATGFTVHTPVSRVIDIGTEFGVEVADHGQTHITVLEGEADLATEGSQAAALRLTRGQTGAVTQRGAAPIRTATRHDRFAMPLRWRRGIEQMVGQVTFEAVAPPSLGPHDYEDAHAIRMIQERSSLTLPEDLVVTFTEPGRYELFTGTDVLPAGTTVTVYLFHYDPPEDEVDVEHSLAGRVTFDRPILGVIASAALLDATDESLGAEQTAYEYPRGETARGMDRAHDFIHLSDDRRSIEFLCHGSKYVDQFRVLVAHE